MSDEQRPGDPADRAADGAFLAWVTSHPTARLGESVGGLLLAENNRLRDDLQKLADWADWAKTEIDRMHAAAKDSADHYADVRAEIDRLRTETRVEINWLYQRAERAERILAALREPSETVLHEMRETWIATPLGANHWQGALRAAVAAAEQEVGSE